MWPGHDQSVMRSSVSGGFAQWGGLFRSRLPIACRSDFLGPAHGEFDQPMSRSKVVAFLFAALPHALQSAIARRQLGPLGQGWALSKARPPETETTHADEHAMLFRVALAPSACQVAERPSFVLRVAVPLGPCSDLGALGTAVCAPFLAFGATTEVNCSLLGDMPEFGRR